MFVEMLSGVAVFRAVSSSLAATFACPSALLPALPSAPLLDGEPRSPRVSVLCCVHGPWVRFPVRVHRLLPTMDA